MRLEGSLDAFSLPDIFALLSMTKKSGGLHVRREAAHGVVWLTSGALTGGASVAERQSLLRRVVSAGGVSADDLRAAVDSARAGGVGILSALLQQGAVGADRVREIAEEHVLDTVFDLLRWESGDFAFVMDEPNPDPVGAECPVDEVVAEARRRLEDWAAVREGLPGPATVLRIAGAPQGRVTLEPDQWSLMVLVDGRRTVADVVELSGRGQYAAVRSLADLVRAGVLCPAAAGETGPADPLQVLAQIDGVETAVASVGTAAEERAEPEEAVPPRTSSGEYGEDDLDQPELEFVDQLEGDEPARPERPTPLRASGREAVRVTPQRAEPFLPGRVPDHPDGSGVAPSTVGALAAATAPASQIERDPSVNKSLLLRLIAGVRGL